MNVQLDNTNTGKREAVLNSTLELIKQFGFHGAPMSLIAKHAKVAAGTIYHYFDSKEALIVELYAYVKHKLAVAILAGDDEDKPYKERFFHFMINQYNFYVANENILLFLEQYGNSPFAKKYAQQEDQLVIDKLIPFFDYGIENAYFRNIDPRLLSPTIKGTLVAAAIFQLTEHITFSESDIVEVVTVVWDGIKRQ